MLKLKCAHCSSFLTIVRLRIFGQVEDASHRHLLCRNDYAIAITVLSMPDNLMKGYHQKISSRKKAVIENRRYDQQTSNRVELLPSREMKEFFRTYLSWLSEPCLFTMFCNQHRGEIKGQVSGNSTSSLWTSYSSMRWFHHRNLTNLPE